MYTQTELDQQPTIIIKICNVIWFCCNSVPYCFLNLSLLLKCFMNMSPYLVLVVTFLKWWRGLLNICIPHHFGGWLGKNCLIDLSYHIVSHTIITKLYKLPIDAFKSSAKLLFCNISLVLLTLWRFTCNLLLTVSSVIVAGEDCSLEDLWARLEEVWWHSRLHPGLCRLHVPPQW